MSTVLSGSLYVWIFGARRKETGASVRGLFVPTAASEERSPSAVAGEQSIGGASSKGEGAALTTAAVSVSAVATTCSASLSVCGTLRSGCCSKSKIIRWLARISSWFSCTCCSVCARSVVFSCKLPTFRCSIIRLGAVRMTASAALSALLDSRSLLRRLRVLRAVRPSRGRARIGSLRH